MILIIDNYDSFTYNLAQQIQTLGARTIVKTHEITASQVAKLNPSKIIISPGPKDPDHAGNCLEIIKTFYKTLPILGVCLGHQCIGQLFGTKVIQAKKILHGKTSKIFHTEDSLFQNIRNPMTVARYHSLVIHQTPKDFTLTAWDQNNEIMAIHHNIHPLFGIQFHPESFLTPEGSKLMQNFLNI